MALPLMLTAVNQDRLDLTTLTELMSEIWPVPAKGCHSGWLGC